MPVRPSPTPCPPEEDVLEEVDEADDAVLTIPTAAPTAAAGRTSSDELDDEDEEDPPGSRPPQAPPEEAAPHPGTTANLDRVNLGLGFYYASILALLAGFVVELAAFAAALTTSAAPRLGRGVGPWPAWA